MQLTPPSDSKDPMDTNQDPMNTDQDPTNETPYDSELDAKTIDLVFLMDSTGSMGTYISSAKSNIEKIASTIVQSEKISSEDLRMCLIAYRDHPPQDKTFVVRSFPFTSDASQIKTDLASLRASGGGDGPEAVTAAMDVALKLNWRPNAAKIIVLIADAPPHGLGEPDDGFPNGDPDGLDPLEIAHSMSQKGIVIYPVACEPTLSTSYRNATDFFRSLSEITGGIMVPLTSATMLTSVIVGGAQEQLDLERLVREMGNEVVQEVGRGRSESDVVDELHERLGNRGVKTMQLEVENVYEDSDEAAYNVGVWSTAANLTEGKTKVTAVSKPRLKPAYSTVSSEVWDTEGSSKMKSRGFGIGFPKFMSSENKAVTLGGPDDEEEGNGPVNRSEPTMQNVKVSNAGVSVSQVKRMVKQSVSRKDM